MDNPSYGMPERHGGVSPGLSNGPSHRRVPYGRPSSGEVQEPATQTIIVTKDYKNSYGMKISGDKPVYVQSVNEGGAAERAGLNSGDTILMVNGINVTQSMHTEVVELIRSSPRSVELTVRPGGRPPTQAMASPRPLHHHHSAPARNERITPPQPVDVDKQRQVNSQREHTLRLMLEKEQRYAESLRSQLARGHDSKLQVDLRCAENHIRALANQLANVAHEYAPLSPVTSLVSPMMDTPPPLPSRNRPLTLVTPPPPPRHYASLLHYTESGEAQGIENLQNALSPATNHYLGAHHSASSLHTHHRTKSSPDPLNLSPAEASRQFIASESMLDLSFPSQRSKSTSACDMDSPRGTPPGTPPPPYGVSSSNVETLEPGSSVDDDGPASSEVPNNIPDCSSLQNNLPHYASTSVLQQHPIISMEDDDMSDQEVGQLENHGPFKSLNMLWNHHAHLAVFMNYLRSNSDCSSLLFFLITDQYREGNAKEMKKWAYEIHSSFLVPGAPLRLSNVDENVAREIDEVLLNESDKEEILRKVFWKARLKAKEELNEQLADFQQKRTAGLSSLFGAQETQLQDCIEDKTKASEIAKDILLSIIDSYKEDLERANVDSRRFTTAAAICTVMNKTFSIRGPHSSSLVERCPTFVSKDKSLKNRLIGKSRKLAVRGHHFVVNQYYVVTYCNHCQLLIGGIGPQGFQCADCSLNIHRHCVRIVEESCPGPLVKKEKTNDRISKLMEKIRPERETRRKPSSANTSHLRRSGDDETFSVETDAATGERPQGQSRRPDPVRESEERTGDRHLPPEDDELHHDVPHHAPRKPSATSINRSESYKERVQKKQLRERRKTSDPNLSKTNDVDLENQGLSYNTNSGSSSNSSLSTSLLERVDGSPVCRSLDSPSNSLETVTGSRTHEALSVTPLCGPLDSDLEAEPDPPDWTQAVEDEVLRSLSAREKKRQEVINELFHTERSHVRNLKVLNQVFYRPMVENQILPHDQIQLLFSNLEEMLDIHSQFSNGLKKRRQESPLVKEVADLLLMMFDGPSGENFQRAAATFCARQQIALESLKERRRKDNKLNSFLTDAEGNPMCRRLQLKDIIPTAMQRLTKYPLLFESLARYTTESPEEATGVHRAVERSKEILNHVNHAVREAEDNQRLIEIQKKLDKSGFEKGLNLTVPNAGEFGNLDLTKHRLIYEGPLNWRISNKQKAIDLHVLLLDDMIILLQKQDDKYYLKFYNTTTGGGDSSLKLSPIIKVSTVLVRHNAVDNNALYLVNTAHNGAQIYDLVAATPNERKMWFRHISEAAEAYKARDGKNRRPDAASATPTPETDPAEDKTKENEGAFAETSKEVDLLAPPTTNSPHDDTSPQTSSPGLPSAEPTPQVSPASEPADHLSRKLGEGLLFPSPGSQRRRQDPVRLTTEESPLIQPSEVVVSQRPVLTAEPVVMPIEKLRRKDEEIRQALDEKRQLVADILHVPREEYENIADIAAQPSGYKEGTELILAAISQVNHMVCLVNDSLRVTEEEAVRRVGRVPSIPAHQIQEHISVLNIQLTQMLKQVKEHDEEKERMRRELQRLREQVHGMHDNQRRAPQKPSPATSSRPNSCISVGSGCDQSEDDTGLQRLELENDADTQDTPIDANDDATTDVFVDALSGEADLHLEAEAEAEDREI